MPVTLITGKLGAGKTLVAVGKIRDALLAGRRVATNLDLQLENLLPVRARQVACVRLPDKPTVADLELLGQGNEEMDETKNGLIVLDELAAWLNSRQWGDKERQPVIDWLIHSRKKGWDVMFICQNVSQIDKQVRESLVEYLVVCRRLDRLKIPFIGWLIKLASGGLLTGLMPRIHVGIVRYGTQVGSLLVESWVYLGRDLYAAYNTRQVFSDSYAAGTFSYLSPWHLKGWNMPTLRERFLRWLRRHDERRARIRRQPLTGWAAKLAHLPPDERVLHARRLSALGLLGPGGGSGSRGAERV